MRGFAWLLLWLGPLASAPAAAGLWLRACLGSVHGADLYAVAGAAAVLLAEGLILSFRGLAREVAVLAGSGLWAGWLWLGMTQAGYRWTALPDWRAADAFGRIVVVLTVLIYLTLFAAAETGRRSPRT
jgi:hypothetical protein